MKKVKNIHAESLYLWKICPSANSVTAEKIYQAKYFLKLANRRFQGFLKIRDYLINSHSISLVIEIEDAKTIFDSYAKRRSHKSEKEREKDKVAIWEIISEEVRHVLSMYVKWYNLKTGRKGSLVARNYERYYFESLDEAKNYIRKIKEEELIYAQVRKRYQPKRPLIKLMEYAGKGMIFLSSRYLDLGKRVKEFRDGALQVSIFSDDVLRKLIKRTQNTHLNLKPTNST